jgi:hypothetical protein
MTDQRLAKLAKYLAEVDSNTAQADFWAGWDRIAGDLCQQVWADDADPDVREAYTDLLADADDAGWAVPLEHCQP